MKTRVLIVDDEASLREMLSILLKREGYEVEVAEGVRSGVALIEKEDPYAAVITDLVMPDGSGMDVLKAAQKRNPDTQIIMITAFATTDQAVEAMRLGAYDYVRKPFKNQELSATLEKALEKSAIVAEVKALRAELQQGWHEANLIGKSAAIKNLRELVKRIAPSPTSVLITGESGAGKEVVARALHMKSARAENPFVVLNCGAVPENLIESELFGHVKGAFTGASSNKEGLFRAADAGTLFLDEIGELPPALQVKLLRVLQDRNVRPVGSEKEVQVDVRVLAATNRDLEKEVESGAFRQDLFYRLNVIRIRMPALRERPEDIPLLAEHFLTKHAALHGRHLSYAPDALRWLSEYSFPGNVRELENIVERGATLARGDLIEREDFGETLAGSQAIEVPEIPESGFSLDSHLQAIERELLYKALEQAQGIRKRAAELLGMSFRSFRYRLAKYTGDALDGEELD